MQLTQASKNLSQPNIIRRVFRHAPLTQQPNVEKNGNSAVYLHDGNSLQRFELSANCTAVPTVNHLLLISYYSESEVKFIYSYDLPSLSEVAKFYGFALTDHKSDEGDNWNLPLQKVTSNELMDLLKFFRKVWSEKLITDSFEGSYCILDPSCIADYDNIVNTIDSLSYASSAEQQQAVVGGYLFCIYKSYFKILRDGIASITEHRCMIGEIEKLLIRLQHRNYYLASSLREYCQVASLSKSHDITEFSLGAQLVWDLYQHFQPALDRKAERSRVRQLHGLW